MRQSRSMAWAGRGAIAVVLAALAAWGAWLLADRRYLSAEQLLAQADRAFAAERFDEALTLSQLAGGRRGAPARAWLVAAAAAQKLKRPDEALLAYERIADDGSDEALQGMNDKGALLLELGRASEAEQAFLRVLARRSDGPFALFARKRLAFLYTVEGRRWESAPHFFELLREGQIQPHELVWLGDLAMHVDFPDMIDQFRQAAPDDVAPLIGLVRPALLFNHREAAQNWLQTVVAAQPEQSEAQALLGLVLLDAPSPADFHEWHDQLPAEAEEHPGVWFARGAWAARQGQPRAAARCFWEAICRDPNHQAACYQLASVLRGLNEHEQAAAYSRRAESLRELTVVLTSLSKKLRGTAPGPGAVEEMRRAAALLESLGRPWEAYGWYQAILTVQADFQAHAESDRLRLLLTRNPPQTLRHADPALGFDLSAWPLPAWPRGKGRSEPAAAPPPAQLQFADVAAAAGLAFTYYNSADPQTEGARMFESTGGGVAVLDYDGDGWPDLYFTQGCTWPPDPRQQEHIDRLFRNLGNGRFHDVTLQAGLGDNRFTQGAAAGDYDSDGWPDLYVANIGQNRLYHNNGDGTFRDVSLAADLAEERWTTSCLIADLNGDGLGELFDVNYVQGDDVYTRVCSLQNVARACVPVTFDPQPDQLRLNLGDGRFKDYSSSAGVLEGDGNGLGIVAADFDGSGRLSLFVANDMTPNALLLNHTPSPGAPPQFIESGLVAGVAFDRDGKALAHMGVAADDANADGLLDLFVTTFFNESNVLFEQMPGISFRDVTREANLRDNSFALLGFGTQFLDADLDGLPDLVLTNGHIDDFTYAGIPHRMRPQVYRNLGGGRFEEVVGPSLGAFFEGEYLGRGLARLDYNRDGLEDFAVSHLDTPAALLANHTQHAGRYLSLELRGVRCARDALGATVTVKAAGRLRVRQLTAGDGYLASNQRQLIFGLGPAERVEEVTVSWPGGHEQHLADLPANSQWLLIEGGQPIKLPWPAP